MGPMHDGGTWDGLCRTVSGRPSFRALADLPPNILARTASTLRCDIRAHPESAAHQLALAVILYQFHHALPLAERSEALREEGLEAFSEGCGLSPDSSALRLVPRLLAIAVWQSATSKSSRRRRGRRSVSGSRGSSTTV
jgi:hypothetical protein